MIKFSASALRTLLTSTILLWSFDSHAANSTYTWVGTTNDLTLSSNWNPQATPISGDIGLFNVATYTPELTSGKAFTIDLMKFTGGAPYTFTIKDDASSLVFTSSGTNPTTGVQNNSGNAQTFNIYNQGQVSFTDFASADSILGTNAGNTNYLVGNTETLGTLTFKKESEAGQAVIVANKGLVKFTDASGAENATISLVGANSSLEFNEISGAGNAVITAINNNKITFNQSSNGEQGQFYLGNTFAETPAEINFKDDASAGAATISLQVGSTANFTDRSSPGAATFYTGNEDTINLNSSENFDFNAHLYGTGTVKKTGSNKINYVTNNELFAGKTIISAGNFALNEKLGGNVFVNSGGMLTGTGEILGNLNLAKDSYVAPGNSIGTMTVAGNYAQAANSTLIAQVDNQGHASQLIVNGQASLNVGSTLAVVPDFIQLPQNVSFTAPVLVSSTGVSGTFTNVVSSNPLLRVVTAYEPNSVFITWNNTFAGIAETPNQRKITNQLQALRDPSAQDIAILSAIATDSPRHQQRTLNQLLALPYANLLVTAEMTNHKFVRRLYNPLRLLVTSHPCCTPDYCCSTGCMVDTWFDAGWTRTNFRGNRNARGFSLKGFETSLGSQVTIDNRWTFGIAGNYERDYIHYKVGGKGKSNTYLGGLYTLYRPSDYYILGDLVMGYTQSKIKRHVDTRSYHLTNHGKPDIYQGTVYVEAGQDFGVDCFLFQPFVGIEAGYFRHDHIHEKNKNLFSVDVKNKTSGAASSRMGVHFLTEFSCFKLFFDGAWQYRMSSLHNNSKERFQNFGNNFTINGIPFARSSFDGALNLSATIVDGWEVYAEAQGQWWKDASTFSVIGGLVIAW